MKIGNVEIKSNILLAPIAGFTDAGFRRLCSDYGAGLTCTEMVSAKGLCYGSGGTEALLFVTALETPVAVQLFGSDPEFMYKAAKDQRLDKFDVIDVNMGCPVRKIFGSGDGSALMKNPALITEIVSAVREGGKKPVTVKLRAGIETGKPLAVECALAAQKGGAAAVTVHPRYRDQFYSGSADHAVTREVKSALDIPVIANGDITDAASLESVAEQTGADGFMIARGALGKPYIFAELAKKPFEFDRREAVGKHIEVLKNFLPDAVIANSMKLHLCHYAKNTGYAKAVRLAVAQAKDLKDIENIVAAYFG